MKWSEKMSFLIALGFLGLWLILSPTIDKLIKKRDERIKQEMREDTIALHARCDKLDAEAERLAQEILNGMKAVEYLPEERRQAFVDKYSELMFEVDRIKSDTKHTREKFPLEEELVNV